MRRFRMAGLFAVAGRDERLQICRAQLGQLSAEQLAAAGDESFNPFAGDEDDEEPEDEGSYVPCPACGKRTSLRLTLEGPMTSKLLEVASAVLLLLQCGSKLAIRSAVEIIARAGAEHCAVNRALLPSRLETNEALIGFTETVVRARLREQLQRGPPEETRR
jgi:hypothetical protein